MNASVRDDDQSMSPADRFELFLQRFTAPLLSPDRQYEAVSIFRGLTDECLADHDAVEKWNSRLTADGAPMELSLVVSSRGHIDVRFLIDPQQGLQAPEHTRPTLRKRAGMVIPEAEKHGDVIDRLLEQHLGDVPDGSASYTAFGTRISPRGPRAGRMYFPNWWRSAETSRQLVSRWLDKDDAARLWASPLGRRAMAGVGYDFSNRGFGRTKVYGWTTGVPKADCSELARTFLPEKADEILSLLESVSSAKHPLWVLPTTLLAVGLKPHGGFSDMALCLPASFWEWKTFRDLWRPFGSMVNRIGIPFTVSGRELAATYVPTWKFVPTWLALTASADDMSVSVYFKPAKNGGAVASARSPSNEPRTIEHDNTHPKSKDQSSCQNILIAMYRMLMETETY